MTRCVEHGLAVCRQVHDAHSDSSRIMSHAAQMLLEGVALPGHADALSRQARIPLPHVHAKNRLLVDILTGMHNKPKSEFKISLRPYSMDFGAMTATRRSSADNITPVIIAPKSCNEDDCASKGSANC